MLPCNGGRGSGFATFFAWLRNGCVGHIRPVDLAAKPQERRLCYLAIGGGGADLQLFANN